MRNNFNLCDKNFQDSPYCNQMGGLLDKNHRFCDVCKHDWQIVDNLILQIKPIIKAEEIQLNSKWYNKFKKRILTLVDIEENKGEGWYHYLYKFEFLEDNIKTYTSVVNCSYYNHLMSFSSGVYPIVKELNED